MKKSIKIILGTLVVVIIGVSGYTAYYFYSKYQSLKNNPNSVAQDETKALVQKIGQLIELPTGEDPTLATVKDKEKLKDQAFFKIRKMAIKF